LDRSIKMSEEEKKEVSTDEVKKNVEKTLGIVEQFKKDNDEAIKNNTEKTAEHQQKIDKMLDDISKGIEINQTQKERLDRIESLANGASANKDNSAEQIKEVSSLFNEFAKKGSNLNFVEYLTEKGKADILKTMSVNSDPDGGFLVLPDVRSPEKTRTFETSPIRTVARTETISSDALEFVMRDGARIGGTWVTEEQARATTDTRKISNKRIPTHEIYSYPLITQKMLDDSSVDVLSWVQDDVREDFELASNTSFVTGNGIGKPRGFLTYSAWAINGTYEKEKIEQIVSGTLGEFTADGIMDLQNSLKSPYQSNAVFMLKRASFKEIAKFKDGIGNYLFNRELDRNVGEPFNLLNRPVVFADDIPVVADNALALVYGDFQRGYMIVDRIGIRVLRDPYSDKPSIGFYTTKRVGGDVYNWEALKIQKLSA